MDFLNLEFFIGGNPVTGEGYESPKSNGNGPQLNGNNNILRNRVPPGGFSSGLWWTTAANIIFFSLSLSLKLISIYVMSIMENILFGISWKLSGG